MDSGRLEPLPGSVHLDTVRALHQTVVSLRTALEVSKNELKELRQKYQQHSQSDYADVIEKLTLENHILRRRIIDSDYNEDQGPNVGQNINQNIKLEVTYSPRSQRETDRYSSDIVIKTATPDVFSEEIEVQESVTTTSEEEEEQREVGKEDESCSANELNKTSIEPLHQEYNVTSQNSEVSSPEVQTQIEDLPSEAVFSKQESSETNDGSFKTKLELLSKFDVRIKVRTIKEGTVISSSTSETDSSSEDKTKREKSKEKTFFAQEHREHREQTAQNIKVKSVSSENIKMAVPNEAEVKSKNDKFDVQVRITSEENLVVKEGFERNRRKDTLNLDVDDLSFRSMSDGDNSVFSEGGATPVDPSGRAAEGDGRQYEQEGSGNESEEVDDIELIFTTDESKDMSNLQEDLVSIRDTEHWAPSPSATHSTPVLIKFHTLDPDFQPGGETTDNAENENQENTSLQSVLAETSLKMKRVSLPSDKEIRHVAFNGKNLDFPGRGILKSCDNKSESMLYKKSPNTSTRRLDSVDSLTCEYNRNLSLDNTKSSSFELGSSSMDILQRDESVDNFYKQAHLGHRFSVFAESDMSKCGISEDDLSGNLNLRRNTCPNPFQFRPTYRGYSRPLGPFKATVTPPSGRRPILRDGSATRRENGAQTDVCALPPRWSSDGYLAHKVGFSVGLSTLPTLPQRTAAAPPPSRRLAVPPARAPSLQPQPRANHTRRQLLSDIGFTSMVPELSRSADPLWTLGQRTSGHTSAEVTPGPCSTTKFFSRGSSYRSPCLSIDRSNDWTPQNVSVPPGYVPWRSWRSSLPDVRGDDTDSLLDEAAAFLRRSGEDLRVLQTTAQAQYESEVALGQPYIPGEPRRLRLGHAVKVITPQGRVALGRVRYVGLAGGTAADSGVMVGAVFPLSASGLPLNDGTYRGRRYFHAPPAHTALFVPFQKVVMAWAT